MEWNRYGELGLFLCSIILGIILLVMSQTKQLLVAFGIHVVYAFIYNGMITIAKYVLKSSQISFLVFFFFFVLKVLMYTH